MESRLDAADRQNNAIASNMWQLQLRHLVVLRYLGRNGASIEELLAEEKRVLDAVTGAAEKGVDLTLSEVLAL
jgi:hypothetical protein